MKVWYTSYGSNLFEDRFLAYINGGKVDGMTYPEIGCKDKTPPLIKKTYFLNANYKFIEHAKKWDDMGVAFISLKEPVTEKILVTSYLIEAEQFIEVMMQENSIDSNESKLNTSILDKSDKELFPGRWYSTLCYLGELDGYSSYTFTCDDLRFSKEGVAPAISYLNVILNGAYSSNVFTEEEVVNHYLRNNEVASKYSFEDLIKLFK